MQATHNGASPTCQGRARMTAATASVDVRSTGGADIPHGSGLAREDRQALAVLLAEVAAGLADRRAPPLERELLDELGALFLSRARQLRRARPVGRPRTARSV